MATAKQRKSVQPVDAAKLDPLAALHIFRNGKPKPKAAFASKTNIANVGFVQLRCPVQGVDNTTTH